MLWAQSNDPELAWLVGNQIGALHYTTFYDDRPNTEKSLQNIIELMRQRSCLDPAPYIALLDRVLAGATPRSLWNETMVIGARDGPVMQMVGRCLCQSRGGTGPDLPTSPCRGGFTGTWDGGGGLVLMLTVEGNQAKGTYRDPRVWQGDAFLSGTVTGRVLEGEWYNPIYRGATRNRGPVRFELAADGRTFRGFWREVDGSPGGEWNGTARKSTTV